MNKNIFIVKLVKPNNLCTYYRSGDYLIRATSEWLRDEPSFSFDPREAAVFSSLKAAENYLKKYCGVDFTYEIIEFSQHKSTIFKTNDN